MSRPIILAITGASGAIYSVRLLQVLLHAGLDVRISISESGRAVLAQELGLFVDLERFELTSLTASASKVTGAQAVLRDVLGEEPTFSRAAERQVAYDHYRNFMAPIASGSFLAGGMVVCPCSGTTLSAIAMAAAGNLIQRAAEVQLKERRKLIVVPRESPLSTLQLENMHRLSLAGAVVLPASPGWYHGVTRMGDLVDFVVARICDQLEVEHQLIRRWGSGAIASDVP